jgi:hypothetical protein
MFFRILTYATIAPVLKGGMTPQLIGKSNPTFDLATYEDVHSNPPNK